MTNSRLLCIFSTLALMPIWAYAADEQITYANQVSRIIQDNCEVCHQPGGIAVSYTHLTLPTKA